MRRTKQLLNDCIANNFSLTEKLNTLIAFCQSLEIERDELKRFQECHDRLPEPSASIIASQDKKIEKLETELKKYKENFWEQRRHCRAANKGAERNNQVMRLLAQDLAKLQEKLKETEEKRVGWICKVGNEEFKTYDKDIAQAWEEDGFEVTQHYATSEKPRVDVL